jgi:hypothetical protein
MNSRIPILLGIAICLTLLPFFGLAACSQLMHAEAPEPKPTPPPEFALRKVGSVRRLGPDIYLLTETATGRRWLVVEGSKDYPVAIASADAHIAK